MKKLTLFVLVVALVAALAVPAMAHDGATACKWGTPVIDGQKDACYSFLETVGTTDLDTKLVRSADYDGNASADTYLCYDGDFIYFFADVTDGTVVNVADSGKELTQWVKDSVEIWLASELLPNGHGKIAFDAYCEQNGGVDSRACQYWGAMDLQGDVLVKTIQDVEGGKYYVEAAIPAEEFLNENEDGTLYIEYGVQINDFKDEKAAENFSAYWGACYGTQANGLGLGTEIVLPEKPAETEAPAEETEAPAEETEAPSDDPSPVTADIAVIAAGIALAAAAVVVFKKH